MTKATNNGRGLRVFISIIASVIVLFLIYYNLPDFEDSFRDAQLGIFIQSMLFHIGIILSMGYAFKILLDTTENRLTHKEWIGLSIISNFLNHVIPYRSGFGFRYLYLRRRFSLSLSSLLQISLVYFLIYSIINLIMLLIGLTTLPFEIPVHFGLFETVGLLSFAILMILVFLWFFPRWRENQQTKGKQVLKALHQTLQHPRDLIFSFLILVVSRFFAVGAMFYSYWTLNFDIDPSLIMLLTPLVTLSAFVMVTPGNIGITESVSGAVTQFAYGDFAIGFSAMLMFRLAQFFLVSALCVPFSYLLIGRMLPRAEFLDNGATQKD